MRNELRLLSNESPLQHHLPSLLREVNHLSPSIKGSARWDAVLFKSAEELANEGGNLRGSQKGSKTHQNALRGDIK
jgi:hypothetical protein